MDKETLLKFFNNQCTPAEQAEVINWIRNPEHKLILINWLKEHWDEFDASGKADINLEYLWQRISKETQIHNPVYSIDRAGSTRKWWYAAAATILMVMGTWWIVQFNNTSDNLLETVYKTEYGQILKINLPDSSKVILNGNSSLTLRQGWNEKTTREVWLDGEGFFSVQHTFNHQKFIVHASDNIGVEVLGTEFSVSDWNDKTRVVLNNGKIKLHVKDNDAGDDIEMRPGDLVEFNNNKNQLVRQQVNPEVYSSWTDQWLVFDNTPLIDVIKRIEETYGVKVEMEKSLFTKRLTGKVLIENLDILLEAMENSFQLKIVRNENKIIIKSH